MKKIKLKPIVICGIDTNVGKSVVTGLLARYLLDQGKVVITQKLVQTGCDDRSEDILLHRRLMGADWHYLDEQQLTCPYCFPFPASPHLAAKIAGTEVDSEELDRTTDILAGQVDQLIIEAAGGLLVPLNSTLMLIDYLAGRSYPIILVTSPRLGSINHTLLALEAIRQREMSLSGLVYNIYGEHPPEIVKDSLQMFKQALIRYGFAEKIMIMPDIKESRAGNWGMFL